MSDPRSSLITDSLSSDASSHSTITSAHTVSSLSACFIIMHQSICFCMEFHFMCHVYNFTRPYVQPRVLLWWADSFALSKEASKIGPQLSYCLIRTKMTHSKIYYCSARSVVDSSEDTTSLPESVSRREGKLSGRFQSEAAALLE